MKIEFSKLSLTACTSMIQTLQRAATNQTWKNSKNKSVAVRLPIHFHSVVFHVKIA